MLCFLALFDINGHIGAISVCHGKKRAELKCEAVGLTVDPRPSPHLLIGVMSRDRNNKISNKSCHLRA